MAISTRLPKGGPDGSAVRNLAPLAPLARTRTAACSRQTRQDPGSPAVTGSLRTPAKSLARHGWAEIGAHTVNHLMMPRQPLTSQHDEIVISRAECEELVGQAPTGFAYPYGDMDSETASLVKRAGFEYACSTAPGAVTPETNPFALPRLAVHDWSGR